MVVDRKSWVSRGRSNCRLYSIADRIFCCQNYDPWYNLCMTVRAAIYSRTSPDCPVSADEQTERLKTIAAERQWTVVFAFTDRPMTVRKCVDRRPGEIALIEAIRNGTIDKVLVISIDRVGRSLVELTTFMETCRTAGVSLWLDEQKVDTEESDALFEMAAMMALHLRQSRRDRILRGQAAARSLKIRFGRPPLGSVKVEKAKRELAAGKGVRQVARLAGISAASAGRIKNAMGSAATL
jgi:DNA invertase Pin-like site-specific DNA recombinase